MPKVSSAKRREQISAHAWKQTFRLISSAEPMSVVPSTLIHRPPPAKFHLLSLEVEVAAEHRFRRRRSPPCVQTMIATRSGTGMPLPRVTAALERQHFCILQAADGGYQGLDTIHALSESGAPDLTHVGYEVEVAVKHEIAEAPANRFLVRQFA